MPDYSQLSDQELLAKINGGDTTTATTDLSKMSDSELLAAINQTSESDTPYNVTAPPKEPIVEPESPASFSQRALISLPTRIEGKLQMAKQLGFKDAQVAEDGRIFVTGQNGQTRYFDPKPSGFLSFMRDLGGDVADWIGPAIPVAGQIGADIAAAPAAGAATLAGGPVAGLGTEMAANAAGGASGATVRDWIANQALGGNQPVDTGEIAMQGIAGGLSVPVARAIEPVAKFAIKPFSGLIKKGTEWLGDAWPDLAQGLLGANKLDSVNLVEQLQSGKRKVSDIINPENAGKGRAEQIFAKTFLGDENAHHDVGLIVQTFQKHMRNAGDDSDRALLKQFYAKTFGFNENTLDVMETVSPAVMKDMELRQPEAWRQFTEQSMNAINNYQDRLEASYGGVKQSVLRKIGNEPVNIAKEFEQFVKQSNDAGILAGSIVNPRYMGVAAKDTYSKVLSVFQEAEQEVPKQFRGSVRGPGGAKISAEDLKAMGIFVPELSSRGAGEAPKLRLKMTVRELDTILSKEIKPLLNKAFDKTLEDYEKGPLTGFVRSLREKIASNPQAGRLRAINSIYGRFEDAKRYFSGFDAKDAGQILNFKNRLEQAFSGSATGGDQTARTFLADIDRFLKPGQKITPKLRVLAAADNIKPGAIWDAIKNFSKQAKTIHSDAIGSEALRDELQVYDSAIRDSSSKFYQKLRDHLTALTYTSNKQNFFRMRAFVGMGGVAMGAGFTYKGHPLLGAAAMGVGLRRFSPAGAGKTLLGIEKLGARASGAASAAGQAASGVIQSPASKAALAQVIKLAERNTW